MARILIIDDDDDLRGMLRLTLTAHTHTVFEARNGRDGLELFPHTEADLVITDILMPEKEGMETLMEIRKQSPATKIIAMSGGGHIRAAEYLNVARYLGAAGVLEKPFPNEVLLAAVDQVLGNRSPAQPSAPA